MNAPVADSGMQALRTPPHNIEAEKFLLGGLMIENRAFETLGEYLHPEHFVFLAHGKIFEACAAVIARGGVADPISLQTILAEDESLAEMGGPGYLSELVHSAVGPIAANEYGRIILDCHERRELIRLGENLLAEAYRGDATETAQTVREDHEKALFEMAEAGRIGSGPRPVAHFVDQAIDQMEAVKR